MDQEPHLVTPLMRRVADVIRGLLPDAWGVDLKVQNFQGTQLPWLEIGPPNAGWTSGFLIEAHQTMTPRHIDATFGSNVARSLRAANGRPMLVMAERLTPEARRRLTAESVSYADLAGNVRLDVGPLFVVLEEARTAPTGRVRSSVNPSPSLRGAKVGQVIRVLIDGQEPASGQEIALAAGVTEGYVSRILETLEGEGLIDRVPRGPVTRVDWPALLRSRAATQVLLARHTTTYWVAPRGVGSLWSDLGSVADDQTWALTGSLVAAELAPIAAPALGVIRALNPQRIADQLGLLPADGAGDVALVRLENWGALERPEAHRGVPCVGLSQLAIDCLSGPGRMPAEGEALVAWMQANEPLWRAGSIASLRAVDRTP